MSSERTNWVLIIAIWLGGLGAAAQYGKVSVVFQHMAEMYPDVGAAVGFTVSLVGFMGIILGVVAGMYVPAIGYRRVLVWSIWLGAAMSALQYLSMPFGLFLASRLFEGISHLGVVVAAPTLIAQVSTNRTRGFAMSLWSTFFGVAFALLAWFGIPLVDAYGVRALFAAHAIVMGLLALMLMGALRQVPPLQRKPAPRLADLPHLHLALYLSPFRAAPAAGWLFYTCSFVAILTVFPPYIEASVRSWVLGAMPLTSILVSMTLGVWLLRWMPAVSLVQSGFLICALMVIWLGLAPGDPMACLAFASGMGLVQSASFAAIPQLNDTAEKRAEASGAMAQAGNLGNTIGTPLMVWVLAIAGYGGLMVMLAALFLTGAFVHAVLRRRRASAQSV